MERSSSSVTSSFGNLDGKGFLSGLKSLKENLLKGLSLAKDLQKASERYKFNLLKFIARNRRIIDSEFLIFWQHHRKGLLLLLENTKQTAYGIKCMSSALSVSISC
jgi:hypothetical protein